MMQFKFTRCPCCQHKKPIPFGRKTSMGLSSKVKCSFCQCNLRVHRLVYILLYLLVTALLPFGFIAGVQVFQLFFGSEFGLSLGYFGLGALLGMVVSFLLALWLFYVLIPVVRVDEEV